MIILDSQIEGTPPAPDTHGPSHRGACLPCDNDACGLCTLCDPLDGGCDCDRCKACSQDHARCVCTSADADRYEEERAA